MLGRERMVAATIFLWLVAYILPHSVAVPSLLPGFNGDVRSNDTFKSNDTLPLDFSSASTPARDHSPGDSGGVEWFDDDFPHVEHLECEMQPRFRAATSFRGVRRRHLYQTPGGFSTTRWIS